MGRSGRARKAPRPCGRAGGGAPCAIHGNERRRRRDPGGPVTADKEARLMSWSVNIGSIAGTAIRIHFTFLLFLAWIFVASWASGGPAAAWDGLAFMLLLFACVLAHEFGHIFTARAFGVPTPDVTLLPIGGVARLARIPEAPREEFLIAIAGPLVNVVIALGLVAIAHAKLDPADLSAMESARTSLIDRLAAVNLFLAAFNMIPAFPMDGGRVLRALLATRLGNPLLIFIAVFVYLAASSEAHLVAIRAMSRDVPVSAAMMTEFATLTPDEHIDAAVETLLRTSQSVFPVIDAGHRLAGVLDRDGMIRALKTLGPDARVANAMTTGVPTVASRSCLEDAFRLLQEDSAPAVGIVDLAGRLVGLITSETVGEMLMVRDALRKGARIGPLSGPSGPLTEAR